MIFKAVLFQNFWNLQWAEQKSQHKLPSLGFFFSLLVWNLLKHIFPVIPCVTHVRKTLCIQKLFRLQETKTIQVLLKCIGFGIECFVVSPWLQAWGGNGMCAETGDGELIIPVFKTPQTTTRVLKIGPISLLQFNIISSFIWFNSNKWNVKLELTNYVSFASSDIWVYVHVCPDSYSS